VFCCVGLTNFQTNSCEIFAERKNFQTNSCEIFAERKHFETNSCEIFAERKHFQTNSCEILAERKNFQTNSCEIFAERKNFQTNSCEIFAERKRRIEGIECKRLEGSSSVVSLVGTVVSVSAIGPKVHGFKPVRDDGILRVIKSVALLSSEGK
jgi:hypothetical protein